MSASARIPLLIVSNRCAAISASCGSPKKAWRSGILPGHTVGELGNPISASGRDLPAAVPALLGGFLFGPRGSYRELGCLDVEVGHEFGGPLGGHYRFVLACPSFAGHVQELNDLRFYPFTLGIHRRRSPFQPAYS